MGQRCRPKLPKMQRPRAHLHKWKQCRRRTRFVPSPRRCGERVAHRASISQRAIDHVLERKPCLEALDLAQHIGDERARVGSASVVRRDGDRGVAPERARRRQRLARKDVERCARERTLLERPKMSASTCSAPRAALMR